jgi:hypothetical protein
LKDYIPQSNWARYFSALVDCEDSLLEKRWLELYELRCMVAHNAIVGRADYDHIVKLSSDLTQIIEQAINKLPDVRVPADEVETVADQAASRFGMPLDQVRALALRQVIVPRFNPCGIEYDKDGYDVIVETYSNQKRIGVVIADGLADMNNVHEGIRRIRALRLRHPQHGYILIAVVPSQLFLMATTLFSALEDRMERTALGVEVQRDSIVQTNWFSTGGIDIA